MVQNIKYYLNAALLGLAVCAQLFYFSVGQIYQGNPSEFSVPLVEIFKFFLKPSGLIILLAISISFLVPSRARSRYLALLASLSILMWFQGALIVWDYGALDGSPIPWLKLWWRGVIDSSVWIALLITCFYGPLTLQKALVPFSITLFILNLSLSFSMYKNDTSHFILDKTIDTATTQQNIFEFSNSKNIVHIVMDGFQADIFNEIMTDEKNQEFVDTLRGFTVFQENTGLFPYTELSVPAIVSGLIYENNQPKDDFKNEALGGNTILKVALNNGYEVDIAAQTALQDLYTRGPFTNAHVLSSNLHTTFEDYLIFDAGKLVDLSLFRVLPHFVKAYVYQDEHWFVQRFIQDNKFHNMNYFADLAFLSDMDREMIVNRSTPVYKLLHLMLSHRPTAGNEHCEYDGIKKTNRKNVTTQARCGLLHIVRVLKRMQELGIYDDSIIILMADHGAWIPPRGYNPDGVAHQGPSTTMAGLALPTLAIKPAGQSGPLLFSTVPSSISDVAKTISELAQFESDLPGSSVFNLQDTSRKRVFYSYAYGQNRMHSEYLNPMQKWEIGGSAYDPTNWIRKALLLPKSE